MESPKPIFSSAIVLDESLFPRRTQQKQHIEIDGFAEFAKETFRRYEESNLNINAFRLCLMNPWYTCFGLTSEWTSKALKLGATDLTFRYDHPNICLPLEQVFGNENVVRLCLEHLKNINQLKVTECPGLKSLTLSDSNIKLDPLFDLISCCPSVEILSLSNIYGGDYHDDDKWSYFSRDHKKGHDDDDEPARPLPAIILPKLRSLVLCGVHSLVQIETLFLDDLSSKFPNLKHLTLGITSSLLQTLEVIRIISSASLETLHIKDMDMDMELDRNRVPRVEFDVPSIRKFTFEGIYGIPDVSFRSTTTDQWEESHLSIYNSEGCDGLSTTWFRQLSNFLTNLRGSKIHLSLQLHNTEIFDYDVGELDGLNLCQVEDLTLDINDLPSLSCHAILDGLFRICRPKMITQYAKPPDNNNIDDDDDDVYRWNRRGSDDHGGANITRKNDLFICRALERAMREKDSVLMSTQFMYGLRDLEEVDAQQLIDEVWTPMPLGSVLADAADSTSDQQSKTRFRLQLKWKTFVVS